MVERFQPDCIFCKIAAGRLPAEIVYAGEHILAFPDTGPKAPVHVLIIPKEHIEPKKDLTPADAGLLGEVLLAAKAIAKSSGIEDSGFRLVANVGPDSGQEVDHLHFHLLGGRKLAGMG